MMLSSTYDYLATIYKHTGKYDLSEQYYLRSVSLIEKYRSVIEGYQGHINGTHQLLAQLYNLTGHYQKAGEVVQQCIEAL